MELVVILKREIKMICLRSWLCTISITVCRLFIFARYIRKVFFFSILDVCKLKVLLARASRVHCNIRRPLGGIAAGMHIIKSHDMHINLDPYAKWPGFAAFALYIIKCCSCQFGMYDHTLPTSEHMINYCCCQHVYLQLLP